MKFIAVKYKFDDDKFTEYEQEIYISDSLYNAVQSCLYVLKLKNNKAHIGPSGQVVYDGFGNFWCITPVRLDNNGNEMNYKDGMWWRLVG